MNEILKKKLGIAYPILAVFLLYLLILTFSRLSLSIWHFERVNAVEGWLPIFLSGLRIDISSLCYLLILPTLLTCLFASNSKVGKLWLVFFRVWIVLGLWFIVYMEVATPAFILEYDARPNRLFIEYLIYPKEVFSMLWGGYKLELFIGSIVSLFTLFFGWKLSAYLVTNLRFSPWYWRPLLAITMLLLAFIGARSSLGHRPLNPAVVAFSTDPLVNDLVLNSAYSMLFAVKQMSCEDNAFKHYGKMKEQDIIDNIRSTMGKNSLDFPYPKLPTMTAHTASYQGKPKNLVILLQESLGARYVGALGGLPLTPNLDTLIQEGWSFTRLYATGTRSARGIEAMVSGFSPTPARAVVKLGKSQSNFFTIADLLKSKGYHTQFVYGGESHFDNMKSFFLGNGFSDIQDFATFDDPEFVGSWGASDEDLYQQAHTQFTQLNKQDKPFFSLVFTSSNHSPFDYPDGKITPYNKPAQTRENAVKYSDFALGKFFKQAKSSDYWDNTIFIVVADHDSRAYGDQLVPINNFHIPGVIIGKGIAPRKDDRLTSNIDLAPTLLSLIGIDSINPMIGHDMTKDIPNKNLRAMMQFYKSFAWMDNNNDVVILQSEKDALGFSYDPISKDLTSKKMPKSIIKKAKANALWGSLAYDKGYYRSLNTTR
ncbi:phosphoglycerol transferase MdoB-like protein [Psychromonas sp. CNPT3]|uniref:LTA synthase family protein n=1 Tax=Psychromonas sp. CNPT3 TaxID=314282 RepID=UPI00006E8AA7|nr:LTA synthase family protein [Psychromonas sp. CNPT3]AGH80491.1 phosphoglycerol transferase MdoB-like protein [Psychromonas sp. CNPT3]